MLTCSLIVVTLHDRSHDYNEVLHINLTDSILGFITGRNGGGPFLANEQSA